MIRFALEEFPTADLADKFSIARRHPAAHGDGLRATPRFPFDYEHDEEHDREEGWHRLTLQSCLIV